MSNMSPLRLAGLFHNEYVTLAPVYGLEPMPEFPPDFRPTSPHGRLLMRVCEKLLKEILGCQKCGGHRFHIVNTLGNDPDIILGDLELCLDCGQVQGKWPYNTGESE